MTIVLPFIFPNFDDIQFDGKSMVKKKYGKKYGEKVWKKYGQ